jgi:hypothetical protein
MLSQQHMTHTDVSPPMTNGRVTAAQLERLSPARRWALHIVVSLIERDPSLLVIRTDQAYQHVSQWIRETVYTISQQLTRRA